SLPVIDLAFIRANLNASRHTAERRQIPHESVAQLETHRHLADEDLHELHERARGTRRRREEIHALAFRELEPLTPLRLLRGCSLASLAVEFVVIRRASSKLGSHRADELRLIFDRDALSLDCLANVAAVVQEGKKGGYSEILVRAVRIPNVNEPMRLDLDRLVVLAVTSAVIDANRNRAAG